MYYKIKVTKGRLNENNHLSGGVIMELGDKFAKIEVTRFYDLFVVSQEGIMAKIKERYKSDKELYTDWVTASWNQLFLQPAKKGDKLTFVIQVEIVSATKALVKVNLERDHTHLVSEKVATATALFVRKLK